MARCLLLVFSAAALLFTGCSRAPANPKGTLAYHFFVYNKTPCLGLTFDSFGSRINSYLAFRENLPETTLILPIKAPSVKLIIYDIGFDEIDKIGQYGNTEADFNEPTDISLTASAGGLFRLIIADPGSRRIDVFSSLYKPLRSVSNPDIERPVSAFENTETELFVACDLKRTLFRTDYNGAITAKWHIFNNKPLGANLRLRPTSSTNFLCIDPDNDRVLLLSRTGEMLFEYTGAAGRLFDNPVDALISNKMLLVLDRGNSRLVRLNRNAVSMGALENPLFARAKLILPTEFGYVVFTDDADVVAVADNLDLVFSRKLGRNFTGGSVTSGSRFILASAANKCLYEYRISLSKAGETWGKSSSENGRSAD